MTYRTMLKRLQSMSQDALDWDVTIEIDGEFFQARDIYKMTDEDKNADVIEPGCPVLIIN